MPSYPMAYSVLLLVLTYPWHWACTASDGPIYSMQDKNIEASSTISQLLGENYLSEKKLHHENSEGADDFSDLSAFLSQEELDQSVHLARESIDQDRKQKDGQINPICPPRDLKKQFKPSVRPPDDKITKPPSNNKVEVSSSHQEPHIKVTKSTTEGTKDLEKNQRTNPHGTEAETKKEFLNKAADFIEELSSLFKANSSKRIRPKTLKNRRSKRELKSGKLEEDISSYSNPPENRERPQHVKPLETEITTAVPETGDGLEAVELETDHNKLYVEQDNPVSSFYLQGTIEQPPRFIQKLKSREVTEGTRVQLDCIVVGIPAPEVRWYCEGKELENSPDIQIHRSGDLNSLVITEAFEEDTGRYSCFASNIYGTDSTSAEIYVEGASSSESEGDSSKTALDQPQCETSATQDTSDLQNLPYNTQEISQAMIQQSQSPTSYLQGPDGKPLIAAPVFTKTLQDLTSSEGQLVVFESRVKGSPSPKVEWYREGTLIEDSPDFRILQKKPRSMAEPEEICTLVIAEVFSEDAGMFTCTASNKYGTTSSTARLFVKADFTPKPKLEGVLVNHNEPRSSSKIGLRVHFKLPEEDKGSEASSEEGLMVGKHLGADVPDMLNGQTLAQSSASLKEPPPVLAKPKLDPLKLQQLHNQVMSEQQSQPSVPYSAERDGLSYTPTSAVTQPYMFLRPVQYITSSDVPISKSSVPGILAVSNNLNSSLESASAVSLAAQLPDISEDSNLSSPLASTFRKNPFQTQTVSPTPASPTRIQNPVAFLSSVLPSLSPVPTSTNKMGLPKSTSLSFQETRKNAKSVWFSAQDETNKKKDVVQELERKLSFRDDTNHYSYRQQEYKISSFEQRLMNEIEFRLERTPVDESDDEVEHDEIPTGKCIAPIFDKRLKHFRVVEETSVTFTCRVVGIPMPKVYWFKDGKQISKKNEHCRMRREVDGTCSLHIDAATNDDDGNYTIMAANPQGRISCSGHLLVQTTPLRQRSVPSILSHRSRARLAEVDSETVQERFFRPYFLQAPGDMVANEGRLCRLDCKVSGLPAPDIMWILNGKAIRLDASHKMLIRENGIHSLLIDPLVQTDAGTYTCIATNKTGQNSFSLELSVVAKELKKAPMFLEKLRNCGVPEGHPIRLESRVIGMPPPVFYWKKDNETIPAHKPRISMHQDTTGYVCLLIQPTKKEDAGWYTLSAKNEAGIVSCTARLDIYAQWYQQIPQPIKKTRCSSSYYSTFSAQSLDIFSTLPSSGTGMRFPSVPTGVIESEEL
ncbi:myopalladin isoform X2 [Bombina bombina]|uniref:myopalladin isoform X2 n=1 Tax=Bombina bombina TaxID=8345 RepID=UPI00235A9BBA|nr:myopalladin isoform X2 [Bombina bombina]